jgi:3-oxoacyl-[acyl-carrier-protein] synthase II
MRPFDKKRDGFLMGEGAAFLVLEELTHALDRGAKIYAELAGHGRSCEAYHSVLPHPDGLGMCRAMEKALRMARLHPTEIDYINAHGTATLTNDPVETMAIKRLLGKQANRVAVSATKPVTGHLLGAAGAVETLVCALALDRQVIPPTINLTEPAEDCDLDYVPDKARAYPLKAAMNVNSGFAGKNSCLILKAYRFAA